MFFIDAQHQPELVYDIIYASVDCYSKLLQCVHEKLHVLYNLYQGVQRVSHMMVL
jgi:hypothetical protein